LEKTSQFQDQKHQLEEAHHFQIREEKTKLQESLTENSNLKSLLSQKEKENDQLNQNLNAEGLKFKSLIEQLQRELKTSQETQRKQREQNLTEKKMLKTNHDEGLRSLKNQFENEKKKLLQNYEHQINEETEKHQQALKEKLKLANDNKNKQHEKILKEKVQMMTIEFQENTTKLVQDHEKQIETLNVNANKSQEANKSLKHTLETERLQFQDESKHFKSENQNLKVKIVAQNNQTEKLKQEFENERNIFSDEIKNLSLGATEYQTEIRTLEEKLSASKDENNSSKDRISKLSDDLEAANQQLEPFLTQEKINQKMIDDQNALALAVEDRNQEKVSAILKNSELNINSEMKFVAKRMDGSVLVLAIQNGDIKMIKMLVQDFGANVNQKITWNQNPSNLLILAMVMCFER
jgi:hypothetical protein